MIPTGPDISSLTGCCRWERPGLGPSLRPRHKLDKKSIVSFVLVLRPRLDALLSRSTRGESSNTHCKEQREPDMPLAATYRPSAYS